MIKIQEEKGLKFLKGIAWTGLNATAIAYISGIVPSEKGDIKA